ncbi:dTDP-4-amino-4,6-dideoxygalactose transaminase [Cohnella sp. CFH 77786]|uniref:dTDP-4-amino-4,6-dideoxygalactose transaminase n=1 Tax=Cohnella sp. CFH 77786 TaxID=2662265 RepID=UPI001C60C68D|nr:dTDP-4-amino-4,6-dideoxygalactose transaminase [Cohnella sp. CFH 77786]MBW5444638.1 dTDP-4-amino-4,6-dideoxygalactose transaminase [Cohnella sp. CFH 77786]
MIPFNKPAVTGKEITFIREAMKANRLAGDGPFSLRCSQWLERTTGTRKALLTTSCTHALEMAAMLAGIGPGDEVIMPSYTFVSTANAFALRGARIVFVDIRPDTMNLDENLLEEAVTPRTKAIVPVHYAGVGCDMAVVMKVAERHGLIVIEDAAQGLLGYYRDRPLGTIGHLGCISFHETKNIHCGEGGALFVNDPRFIERAEIIREKGTNRSRFFRGEVDKYSWEDVGSSYLLSDINAAFLYAQLLAAEELLSDRMDSWRRYEEELRGMPCSKRLERLSVPEDCRHNAHIFFVKTRDLEERTRLIAHLKENGVYSTFHYVPLHSSVAGKAYGRFHGVDRHTTRESERLVRLPLYSGMKVGHIRRVVRLIRRFYLEKGISE